MAEKIDPIPRLTDNGKPEWAENCLTVHDIYIYAIVPWKRTLHKAKESLSLVYMYVITLRIQMQYRPVTANCKQPRNAQNYVGQGHYV